MIRLTEPHIRLVLRVMESHPYAAQPEVRDLIDVLRESLTDDGDRDPSDHTGELVELVAEMLMSGGNSRNIIGGDALQALRRGLLLPRELTASARMFSDGYRACAFCGKTLDNHELVTLYRGSVACVSCYFPQHVNCGKCKSKLKLPDILMRVITKLYKECVGCKNPKPKVAQEAMAGSGGTVVGGSPFTDQPIYFSNPFEDVPPDGLFEAAPTTTPAPTRQEQQNRPRNPVPPAPRQTRRANVAAEVQERMRRGGTRAVDQFYGIDVPAPRPIDVEE